MWGIGSGGGRRAARAAFVEGYEFRGSVLGRFRYGHPEIGEGPGMGVVEAGVRQWFRLLAGDPDAVLAMPSVAVSDFWREMSAEKDAYAEFCAGALGRAVVWKGPPVSDREDTRDPRGLARTLVLARKDEAGDAGSVPLLFRVDAAVGVVSGRRYVGGCGGGSVCYRVPGMVCLHHLAGLERPLRRTYDPRRDRPASREGPRAQP